MVSVTSSQLCGSEQAGGGGGGGVSAWLPTYRSRLGEPEPGSETRPCVAQLTIAWLTAYASAAGLFARYSAAAPATCGVAIEVPL